MMADVHAKRKANVERILQQKPDHVPIVVISAPGSSVPQLDRNKFVIFKDITVGQFICFIRRRMPLAADKALFFLVDGKIMPPNGSTLGEVYAMHKREDNLLVLWVTQESTFGGVVDDGDVD